MGKTFLYEVEFACFIKRHFCMGKSLLEVLLCVCVLQSYSQRKVLEYTFNSAFFIAIVLLQWANTVACKTRKLSVIHHGMLLVCR